MVDMKDYTQELLANLLEELVNMHELRSGDMSMEMGAELVQLGDKLAELLEDFIEMNR